MPSLHIKKIGFVVFLGIIFAFGLTATACKKTAPTAAPTASQVESLTLALLQPVFGEAQGEIPGIIDVQTSAKEVAISYHFDPVNLAAIDKDLGRDLGPKIKAYYEKFKTTDRTAFLVAIPGTANPTGWKPYVSFVATRKIIENTDAAKIAGEGLFQVVLELKYAE